MADQGREARHDRRVRHQRDAHVVDPQPLAQARRRRRQQAALVCQQLHQARRGRRRLRVPRLRLCMQTAYESERWLTALDRCSGLA